MEPIIQTNRLTKQYSNGLGCFDVSLSVQKGSIFGLLGPNGAGKSTFIKTIVGLMRPTSGEAQIMGFPIGSSRAKMHVGYLPELFRYQDWLTPKEILQFHGYLHTHRQTEVYSQPFLNQMERVLSRVGLDHVMNNRMKSFSKGMQQRLGLACALVMDPDILILDEPSSALDPLGRHNIRELLVELKKKGKTIFLNTHLLEDVEQVCDDVALLYKGRVQATNKVETILYRTKTWILKTSGWDQDLIPVLKDRGLSDVTITEKQSKERTILEVIAENEEEIGWLNFMLADLGVTVYEVKPYVKQLEEWFLDLTERKGERL